jgi:putative phosphoribosyl transferase
MGTPGSTKSFSRYENRRERPFSSPGEGKLERVGRATEQPGTAASIPAGAATLQGDLEVPADAMGIVVFAHGAGSSRHSPRNRMVAEVLRGAALGTLLMDLLTPEEERRDMMTRELRFDIELLGERAVAATDWLLGAEETGDLGVGTFGASTGAAAALIAAAERPERVRGVVSRGGRPDLAAGALTRVRAPTLLIVGGEDAPVIEMNREAMARLGGETRLEIVPGATHLFEEPGALERVAELAADWFLRHLPPSRVPGRREG